MKKYLLLLFLFPIMSAAQVDLSIDSIFHRSGAGGYFDKGLEYYEIPYWSTTSQDYSCLLSNNGSSNATNVYLRTQVLKDGNLFYESFSDSINLMAGNQDSLFVNEPFSDWIDLFGDVTIKYNLFQDSIDINPNNDSSFYSMQLEGRLSKHHIMIENGSISPLDLTDTTSMLIGSVFLIDSYETLGGFSVFVDSVSNSSTLIYGRLYKFDTLTNQWQFLSESPDMPVAILGENKLCLNPSTFNPGDLGLFMVGTFQEDVFFKSIKTTDINEVYACTYTGEPMPYDPILGHVAIMVEPWYSCWGSVEESESNYSLSIHPNPTSEKVQLNYNLQSANEVYISIADLKGVEVFKSEMKAQTAGENMTEIDVSMLSEGCYILRLRSGEYAVSERLIIQK